VWRLTLDKDKQQLRYYLLGSLTADDRVVLEERLLFSEELHQELMIIEQELVDEYVTGELSPIDRKGFEAHFLEDAFRKEQLRFGESFNSYLLNSITEELPRPININSINLPAPKNFPFGPGFLSSLTNRTILGASCVVVMGIFLAGAYLRVVHRAPSAQIERVVVALDSGATRSEGVLQRVEAPPPHSEVRLELKVPSVRYDSYKAELFKEEQSLDVHEGLTAEAKGAQTVVPVVVEGEILEPGDYQVKLSGSSEPSQEEAVGTYAFRVLNR
jgi:hypothetical protein